LFGIIRNPFKLKAPEKVCSSLRVQRFKKEALYIFSPALEPQQTNKKSLVSAAKGENP